jgi:hypothetical protein
VNGLELKVSTRQDTLLIGEPLVVEISLTNVSQDSIRTDGPLRQQPPETFIFVSFVHEQSGAEGRFNPGVFGPRRSAHAIVMAPGQTIECTYWFGGQLATAPLRQHLKLAKDEAYAWALPLTGRYALKVTFAPHTSERKNGFWRGRIDSDLIYVVVVEPRDRNETQALRLWDGAQHELATRGHRRKSAHTYLAQERKRGEGSCQSVMTLGNNPYEAWARYLNALLAETSLERLTRLEDVARLHPSFVLNDEVMYEIAAEAENSGLSAAGRWDAAIRVNPNHVARVDPTRHWW